MADQKGSRLSTASLLSQEKGTVVIDIGRVYTKIGVAGEAAPRHIIRSVTILKPHGQKVDVWSEQLSEQEELYSVLCRFVQSLFLKYLVLNPKDYRVVVVESFICSESFRNTLAKVLFQHLCVTLAVFMPSHLLCLFTVGRQSALIMDIGFKETTVLPVYEGIPVVVGWQSSSSAAEALQSSLKQLLLQNGKVKTISTGESKRFDSITVEGLDAILEDILVRTCFVRPFECDKDRTPPSVEYPLNKEYILTIDGHIRDHVTEVLFDGLNGNPLQNCILESLIKCPIDTRRQLAENIIVVGGCASLQGLKHRLKSQMDYLLVQNGFHSLRTLTYKFHNPPIHENSVAWLGGSIFGSSDVAISERGLTREKYKELGALPDWTSRDPQRREQRKPVSGRKALPLTPAPVAGTAET
ncbi:hypothetical protein EMCRGX_G032812 [Ephydatia muelleri]